MVTKLWFCPTEILAIRAPRRSIAYTRVSRAIAAIRYVLLEGGYARTTSMRAPWSDSSPRPLPPQPLPAPAPEPQPSRLRPPPLERHLTPVSSGFPRLPLASSRLPRSARQLSAPMGVMELRWCPPSCVHRCVFKAELHRQCTELTKLTIVVEN